MPTSQPRTLSAVHTIVQSLMPSSVIDIGVGHGKTGVLLRDYLEIMNLRYQPESWRTRIYGIEPFEQYRNPLWEYAYDNVIIGDALSVLGDLPNVDLILALDVWEHFEPAYASRMLVSCLDKASSVLICTPMRPLSQGAVLENTYERHVSRWSPRDFRAVRYRLFSSTGQDWVVLLSGVREFRGDVRHMMSTGNALVSGMRSVFAQLGQYLPRSPKR